MTHKNAPLLVAENYFLRKTFRGKRFPQSESVFFRAKREEHQFNCNFDFFQKEISRRLPNMTDLNVKNIGGSLDIIWKNTLKLQG